MSAKQVKTSIKPATMARLNQAATTIASKYYAAGRRVGDDAGWRRGFKVGALLAFATSSLLWGVALVVVVVAR